MNPSDTLATPEKRTNVSDLPPDKWWGRFVVEGNPPQQRFVIRWGRILTAFMLLGFTGYLVLVTALWGYFSIYRKIPNIAWIDVAVLPRYGRVQSAMGNYYYSEAKRLWEKQEYVQAVMTARAAVLKSPRNLEARLFLADCWRLVGRTEESIRVLKEGIEYDPKDRVLQKTLMDTCQVAGRWQEVLRLLREEYPAHGVRLLEDKDRVYQIAEVRAVLETAGPAEAEALVARHAGFAEDASVAPLLARIDWDLERMQAAFDRLATARERAPENPEIHEAYVEAALRMGKTDEARAAADRFLAAFQNQLQAQLKFLEAHGSRQGVDERPWMMECMYVLAQYRHVPVALGQLASLAASQGWTDLTFLLYQNSLEENLTGFPFAVYYVASLVKHGDYAMAETAWRELSIRNAAQLASAPHLEVLVLYGAGRESEAMQIVERLRRETESDPARRRILARIFKTFGFPKLAEQLVAPKVETVASEQNKV